MTDTIEHGRLQAASSLERAIGGFDFGTNTGSGFRRVTNPKPVQMKYNFSQLETRAPSVTTEKLSWFEKAPTQVSAVPLPPKGIVNDIKSKIENASTGEKLAGIGIGAGLLRFL